MMACILSLCSAKNLPKFKAALSLAEQPLIWRKAQIGKDFNSAECIGSPYLFSLPTQINQVTTMVCNEKREALEPNFFLVSATWLYGDTL